MNSVLLQIARAYIYNMAAPHHFIEVRLLLDSGSQRSYLSERVMKLLQLEPTGEYQLSSVQVKNVCRDIPLSRWV